MIRFVLMCGLLAHIAVAVWNGFFGPSLGAEGDALVFHQEAIYYANNLGRFEYVTGWVYAYVLGLLYRIFSDHIFFGSMVSVAAWFMAATLLNRTMKLLDQSTARTAIVIAIFSFWPSAVLNTSVTLREAFQVLAINAVLFGALSSFWKGKGQWAWLFFGMALGSMLHGALLIFSGAMFFYTMYYVAEIRIGLSRTGRLAFVVVVGGAGLLLALTLLGNIAYNVDQGVVAAVQSFNEGAIAVNARADYRSDVYFPGPLDFVLFIPVAFIQYMLEPLPGRISSPGDAALFGENVIRFALLIAAFIVNLRLTKDARSIQSFVLAAFVGLSLIWAIGSVNWGTASRHQVPGLGMLLIAAFYSHRNKLVRAA